MIDSKASSHLFGNHSLLTSPRCPTTIPPFMLIDDSHSPVLGVGIVSASKLSLSSTLYVLKILLNQLSISKIVKNLNCSMTFMLCTCVFEDIHMRMLISGGYEGLMDFSILIYHLQMQLICCITSYLLLLLACLLIMRPIGFETN